MKRKYIEKTKYAIDTKSEKSGLSIAKLLKQQRKPKRTLTKTKARKILRDKNIRGRPLTKKQKAFFKSRAGTKRKITPSQRKVMLRNLKKARRARMMKNLKGGKRK